MTAPYQDPALPVAERVADLVGRMTLPEKVGQMMQLTAQGGVADLVLNLHVGSIQAPEPTVPSSCCRRDVRRAASPGRVWL